MANHDASDILATALKEMDDIIKSNDVMISEMKAQQTGATFSPAMDRRFSSPSIQNERRPSQTSTASSGGGLPSSSLPPMGPAANHPSEPAAPDGDRLAHPRRPSGASAGQEDKAMALLSELRSCMSEVSGVREVFRDLSSENQVFLRQLVGEMQPETGTMKSTTSISSTSTKATSLHSLTTPLSPLPARPTMGTSGSLQRAAILEEEKRNLLDQVSILREQVDSQQQQIKELEKNNKQTNVSHKLDMMAEISQQRVRILTLEREKKDLEDLLHNHKRQINDLKLQLLQQEKELLLGKNTLSGDAAIDGASSVSSKPVLESNDLKAKLNNDPMTRSMPNPAASSTPVQLPPTVPEEPDQPKELPKPKPQKPPQNLGSAIPKMLPFDPMTQSAYAGTSPIEETVEPMMEDSGSLSPQKSSSLGELPTQQVARSPKPPPPLTPPTRHRNAVVMPTSTRSGLNGYGLDQRFASLGRGSAKVFGSAHDDDDVFNHDAAAEKKRLNFKRFLGRIKRGSQDIDPADMNDELGSLKLGNGYFQRGAGLRSTAGPRLGLKWNDMVKPEEFAQWDCDQVCTWLHDMGLGQYVISCRRWIRHGAQLLQASRKEMEKELGLRSSLHLKKLVLAVDAMRRPSGPMKGLAFSPGFSATRWLDDIGLPQYKTAFAAASLDARVLNSLTWDDLHNLKINVELHCLSLKRGIQVLRKIDFNLDRLRRRPNETSTSPTPEEVCLWSNHQVMEWLRLIDFPEFASNLRGSGIHGALMVLEPRFNADVLASLLNIPTSKTLLRRHLSTHFISLIGSEVQQKKRDAESHYEQLTPYSKIKPPRRKTSFFTKRGRTVGGNGVAGDDDELLCPLGDDVSGIDLRKIQALTAAPKEMMIETNIDDLSRMSLIDYENAPSTNV